jgi:hypothetical protein
MSEGREPPVSSSHENVVTVVDSKKRRNRGEMAEWLKAHAWKACIPQGIQGSNPCLSATNFYPTKTSRSSKRPNIDV